MGSGEQRTKRTSKKTRQNKKQNWNTTYVLLHNGQSGIGVPATPKTKLPMTISNCLLAINIITKSSISDATETLNSPLVIAMQNSPTIILLDSGQHPERVFPGHLYALLTEVLKFPMF